MELNTVNIASILCFQHIGHVSVTFQDFEDLLTFIEETIEDNVERLSECGSDKMFQNLSAVFKSLFALLRRSQTPSQAEETVSAVHSSVLTGYMH